MRSDRFFLMNEVETRVTRLKLERRRQTLIHLGFRLSRGGLDAAIEKALGRTLQGSSAMRSSW
jgi:hypothetical protein